MKIVVISTTILPCPPKGYAGLEQLAYQQAEGLSKLGHQVLLVAPVGSTPPQGVELHGTTLGESEMQAYSGYWQRLNNYDAIIDNSWQKWSYMLKIERALKIPILGVLHAPAETMYVKPPPVEKPCLIAISKDQAESAKKIWGIDIRVAYNGVDMNFYKSNTIIRNNKLLFLARISRIKGPDIALHIAKKLDMELDIVGDDKITGEPDLAVYIRNNSTGKIKYHGGVDRNIAVNFFSSNRVLLHMNKLFREPFGLAPVEAQACGMPVIAFDNGAMRETIKHGETGFLVKSEEEVINILKSGFNLNANRCREWASQFSIQTMVKRYEELIKEGIEKGW